MAPHLTSFLPLLQSIEFVIFFRIAMEPDDDKHISVDIHFDVPVIYGTWTKCSLSQKDAAHHWEMIKYRYWKCVAYAKTLRDLFNRTPISEQLPDNEVLSTL